MNQNILGDCLIEIKNIKTNSIDLILTDPPYGMNFVSSYRNKKHKKIDNDDNLDWLDEYIKELSRIGKNNSHYYIFCSIHKIDEFVKTIKQYLPYKNILIWEKNNTGMGDLEGDYAPKYEFCIFCSNGERKLNGNRDSNILKFSRTQNQLHPTQKPVELFQYLIEKSTKPGEVVFDGFAGSGTTAVASIKSGREYICIEKDLEYSQLIERRIKSTTPPLFIV